MSRKTQRDARRAAYRKGHLAEMLAGLLLRAKGYRILAHRSRSPAGEIDLVVRRGGHFAFVEVKARRDASEAPYAISAQQQQRLWRAAENWLAAAAARGAVPAGHSVSLDVVIITPWRLPRHIPQAFGHRL